MIVTLASIAAAASWSVGTPLEAVPGGDLAVPAGVAVRLVVTPAGAPVVVTAAEGASVDVRGLPDGTLIPAVGTSRTVHVEAPAGTRVWVHTASGTDGAREWDAWTRQLSRWLDDAAEGEPASALPSPPWSGERLRASVVLRTRALTDARVVRLGALHDLLMERPLGGGAYRRPASVGSIAGRPVHVRGPGILLVSVQPAQTGHVVRERVALRLDGVAQAPVSVASTGAVPLTTRRWLPPGVHRLEATPARSDTVVEASVLSVRPELFGISAGLGGATDAAVAEAERAWREALRAHAEGGGDDDALEDGALGDPEPPATLPRGPAAPRLTPIDRVEALWLAGRRDAAARLLPDLLDAPGAVGELARARWMDVAPSSELLSVATPPADTSPEGLELLADAALRRADELPPEVVLALVLRARDPELGALARWMNDLGGARAAGLALLQAASPPVPWGPSPAVRAVREAAQSTRWTALVPDADSPRAPPVLSPTGPGIVRKRVTAGAEVFVTLPDPGEGRFPVLRLRADGPARYRVDGEPRVGQGTLDEALAPGHHLVTVEEGVLLLLDEEVAHGGDRVYEQGASTLPARWTVPDPGVEAWIRVAGKGVEAVAFDDGHVARVEVGPDGVSAPIRVPPHSASFTLVGAEEATASVAMRTPRAPAAAPPPPVIVGDDPLGEIARLSREIARGEEAARLERARLLAALGLRSMAHRDLQRLRGGADRALAARAEAVDAGTGFTLPTAPSAGPRTIAAALARPGAVEAGSVAEVSGQGGGLPVDQPAALEALAEKVGAPWLRLVAGEAWLDRGDLARAWRAALDAGGPDSELTSTVAARTRWTAIRRPDRGEGLVVVPRVPEPPDASLAGKARTAMLAAPWDLAGTLLLRGDGFEVLHPDGEVTLELFCRDERGPGAPCNVDLALDGVPRGLTIPDGQVRSVRTSAGIVEIAGPGVGAAVVIRALRDGAVHAPALTHTAMRATPSRPIVATIAGGAPLRVEVVRGAARVEAGGRTLVLDGPGRGVLPMLETGPVEVRVSGDADVLLARGELRDRPPPPPLVGASFDEPALPRAALDPLFDAAAPETVARSLPGHGASRELTVQGLHEALPTGEGWDAAEIEGRWLRTNGSRWTGATAWARGPHLAVGGVFATAWTWDDGWLRGDLSLGAGQAALPWELEGAGVDAGHVRGLVTARHDLPIGPDVAVRLDGQLQGGWQSGPPDARVDPRAWSRWGLDHPVSLQLGTGLYAHPWRDLTAHIGVDALSNTGPSLDRARVWGRTRLLLGETVIVGLDASLAHRFPDLYRLLPTWEPRVGLTGDASLWTTGDRRLTLGAGVALTPDGLEAGIGLSVLWSDGRGLHDLPPGAEAFRSARDPF